MGSQLGSGQHLSQPLSPQHRLPLIKSDATWHLHVRFQSVHPESPGRGACSCFKRGSCYFFCFLWDPAVSMSTLIFGISRLWKLLWRPPPYAGMTRTSMFFFFNAECLPHPKWKSETGRFWLRPSSLQVCTCPSDRDLNSHFQKSFGVTLPFCGFSPMAFACTYVGTPYYVPPEIWENLPYNNKRWVVSLFG